MILCESWPLDHHREKNLFALINAPYPCMPYFLPLHRCNWIHTSEGITTAQVTGISHGWSTLHPKPVPCVSYLHYSLQVVQRAHLCWGAHRYGQLRRVFLSFSEVRAMWLLSTRHDLVPKSPSKVHPEVLPGPLVWGTVSTRSKATTHPTDTYRIRALYGHNRANDAISVQPVEEKRCRK